MRACPDTGVSVPECSCQRCLEAQVREHQPALLDIAVSMIGTAAAAGRTTTPSRLPRRRAA